METRTFQKLFLIAFSTLVNIFIKLWITKYLALISICESVSEITKTLTVVLITYLQVSSLNLNVIVFGVFHSYHNWHNLNR